MARQRGRRGGKGRKRSRRGRRGGGRGTTSRRSLLANIFPYGVGGA